MIGIHYGQMIANPGSQEAFLITAEWAAELMWAGGGVEEAGGGGGGLHLLCSALQGSSRCSNGGIVLTVNGYVRGGALRTRRWLSDY